MSATIIELLFEFGEKYLFTRCDDGTWCGEHWERKSIWESENYGYKAEDIIEMSRDAIGIRVA